jgi:hypothetical protein
MYIEKFEIFDTDDGTFLTDAHFASNPLVLMATPVDLT